MKGIAHFSAGVAVASCFPAAVTAGAEGNPLYFVLGGVFGLLPDTLDFKFFCFFYRHDIEVTPDPNNPDARTIADCLAHAVTVAHETGRPVRIKLNTVRLGTDLWQRYKVWFNVADRSVHIVYGPVVNTGGAPVPDRTPAELPTARAVLPCGIKLEYQAVTSVDVFDGPSFELRPTKDGRVIPAFIPWHRQWSHSVIAAVLFGLLAAAVWTPLAGLVASLAYGLHILVDQLGFMGSSLWFPFRRDRTPGLGLMYSAQPAWNLFTVWLSCVIVFWGLYCGTGWDVAWFNLVTLCFYALALPAAACASAGRWLKS